jgi:hypothetical protein
MAASVTLYPIACNPAEGDSQHDLSALSFTTFGPFTACFPALH